MILFSPLNSFLPLFQVFISFSEGLNIQSAFDVQKTINREEVQIWCLKSNPESSLSCHWHIVGQGRTWYLFCASGWFLEDATDWALIADLFCFALWKWWERWEAKGSLLWLFSLSPDKLERKLLLSWPLPKDDHHHWQHQV